MDDEKDAQAIIAEYLDNYPDFAIVSVCENGHDAVVNINQLRPDLIFLDVHLPFFDGFQVIKMLKYEPAIIITTAFDSYGIKAFDHDAVDYLLKPFSYERFELAMSKAIGVWWEG